MHDESIPHGYCHCGCGEKTTIVAKAVKSRGLRKGDPRRFVAGHTPGPSVEDRAALRAAWDDAGIQYGLCLCGCGERTKIARYTDRTYGWLRDEPKRYIFNHQARATGPAYLERDCGYTTPCHIWQRYIDEQGYGTVRVDGRMRGAHCAAWEREHGPVPDGLELDHLCHDPARCAGGPTCVHRACCNPEHLEPVTGLENVRRGAAGAWLRAKTHCPRGHEYTAANTYRGKSHTGRQCRTCRAARQRAVNAAKKARGR